MSNEQTPSPRRHILSFVFSRFFAVGAMAAAATVCLIMLGITLLSADPSVHQEQHLYTIPNCIMDCRDPTLLDPSRLWQQEIERRFHQPTVVMLCHGGNIVANEWVLLDNPGSETYGGQCEDTIKALDREHVEYPDRIVVCLACNPNHLAIHGRPWLYYSPASTWIIPDRFLLSNSDNATDTEKTDGSGYGRLPNVLADRSAGDPDCIGNSYELIQAN